MTVLGGIYFAPACAPQSKPVLSAPPVSDEQLSVYRGFLDRLASLDFRNLAKTTIPLDFKGFPEGRPCLVGIDLGDPSEALRASHTFGPEITQGRQLKILDSEEQKTLLRQRDSRSVADAQDSFQDSPNRGPESNILVLSEIAFDKSHRFAVMKYLLLCGEHCAYGATLVMEKVGSGWTTSQRHLCAMFLSPH
ncbi:MAG TPA: hypothetical protein VEG64_01095 [Candidatus Sulfotelmatobacter sp.]|nr:hypothetical protein [Candidatus Sulfotelmatobacter sp.]